MPVGRGRAHAGWRLPNKRWRIPATEHKDQVSGQLRSGSMQPAFIRKQARQDWHTKRVRILTQWPGQVQKVLFGFGPLQLDWMISTIGYLRKNTDKRRKTWQYSLVYILVMSTNECLYRMHQIKSLSVGAINTMSLDSIWQVAPKQKLGLEGICTSANCHGCRTNDSTVW